MTGPNPFPQPTRQSSFAIIFILGNVLRLLVRQLWVFILILFFNPKKQVFNSFTLMLIGIAGVGAIMSIVNYFHYFFYIQDGELVMEKGVFRKIKVNVPLDRIQTVNFRQGMLHQLFNVVAVDIDTAGSTGKEFSLQAITKEKADALRSFVDQFRVAEKASEAEIGGIAAADAVHPSPSDPGKLSLPELSGQAMPPRVIGVSYPAQTLLLHLSPSDLLKIGVSQNHLRTAGIIMAFFLGFADDVEEALGLNFSKKMEAWLGTAEGMDILYYVLLGLPFLLIASFLITLVRTALQHFDLKFWRTERGFKIVSGLFTRQEVSANLQKVQFIRWTSSPLMRLFDMMALRLPQAASVEVGRKLSVSLPGCYGPQLEAVREAYFPREKNLEHEEHGVDKRIIRRQFFLQGILPVAVLMLLTRSLLGGSAWVWVLWLPFALWLSVKYFQSWRWFVSEEGIRANWGVINRVSVLLQWYKVQAVTIRQSVFLRRVGLAHLVLSTAAGDVTVPYIPIAKAKAVQDFVLFKIETDTRAWM